MYRSKLNGSINKFFQQFIFMSIYFQYKLSLNTFKSLKYKLTFPSNNEKLYTHRLQNGQQKGPHVIKNQNQLKLKKTNHEKI